MKILYVGTERAEAQAIATAVHSLGEHVRVSWTAGLDRVANWINENDGLRVLVVEAQPSGPAWRPVLTYAAGLPFALPVVVIVPEGIASGLQPPALAAHERITRNPSLLRDLPGVITRAIDQAQQCQPERAMWADLELKLAQATTAIQEAERRHQSAMAAAAEQLARNQSQYEMGMARAAATRDMVNEQFREAALEVEKARLRQASAVADAERLARLEAELSAQLDSATRTRGDLERRLADAETALQAGEARVAEERRSAAELVAERQREFEQKISEEIDKRRGVEDTLTHSLTARTVAEQRHASTLAAAAVQSRELQGALDAARHDLDEQIRQELEARASLEQEIADAGATLAETRREHESAAAVVARLSEREASLTSELAERQAHFARERAQAEAERAGLTAQLREAEGACDRARREHQSVVAEITQLTEREAELGRMLEEERATRDTLEQAVAHTAVALREEQQRHEVALKSAAGELAERQAQFARERAQAEAERGSLIAQLREVEEARNHAQREHESVVADVTRLTDREIELETKLNEERTTRDSLEQAVAHTAATLQDEQQRHEVALKAAAGELAERQAQLERERAQAEAERGSLIAQLREVEEARNHAQQEHQSVVAEITQLTEREVELERTLAEGRATRDSLEQAVADSAAALQDEQQRHEVALKSAAGELAERQAQLEREQAQAEAERAGLTAQLRDVEEARDRAQGEHQSVVADVTRLTERKIELEAKLNEERARRETLEQAVADGAAALQAEQQRHEVALKSAAGELAERQAQFERELAQAGAERGSLTAQLRDVEEARDRAQREHESVVADVTRLTERKIELETKLNETRATRDTLEQAVADTAAALQDEQQRHEVALKSAAGELAERQAQLERERAQAEAERGSLTAQLRDIEEGRDHAQREHQSAVADVMRLTDQGAAEREAAAACQRDLECRLGEAEDANGMLDRERLALQQSLHATQEELHRLDREHRDVRERLEQAHTEARIASQDSLDRLTREYAAVLTTREDDIEQLRNSLHESRSENQRLFQQAPLPMFRCTKDGVLTHANRLLTTLVRRSAGELIGADLAAATFESPSDLSWLIARCLGSKGRESAETTWRRKDGSRLLVRVSACAISPDLVECGVEDLTPTRVLNDRLSQAHRMEAVGRLATEVAVTCGSLLDSVHQNAQQWLMTDGSDPAFRHHGEMLLEEISRAVGLLRQFVAYGDEESRTPEVVELRTVVRDVAPVLKRVAGDCVDVQLSSASDPLNVDAGAERVKRLFVNLAAYGRDRMPSGGRLKIELGKTVVDRHFAAKHPNVRLGPHALVTVTERRRSTPADGLLQLHENEAGSPSRAVASHTGVDLGTLQELVSECGGHLWMTVEPAGDMEVKIRLPLVTSYDEPPQGTLAVGGRTRTLGNWFQH